MPTNSSRTPSAIRSGRVAPVNDFSSARVKLTFPAFLAGPKRIVLSLCEPATGGILTTRYGTLKSAAVRARMRNPGRLPARARARHTTTTQDAGVHASRDPRDPADLMPAGRPWRQATLSHPAAPGPLGVVARARPHVGP